MVDKKVKMRILEDLGGELREVEDGFIRSEHYVRCGDEMLEE